MKGVRGAPSILSTLVYFETVKVIFGIICCCHYETSAVREFIVLERKGLTLCDIL